MIGNLIKLIMLLALIVGAFYLFYPKPELAVGSNSTSIGSKQTDMSNSIISVTVKNTTNKPKDGSQASLHNLKNSIQNVIDDSVQEEIQEAVEKKILQSENSQQ